MAGFHPLAEAQGFSTSELIDLMVNPKFRRAPRSGGVATVGTQSKSKIQNPAAIAGT